MFKKFQEGHETSHSHLEDPESIEESRNYYESVLNQVEQLQENVDLYLAGVEESRLITSFEINPEDSISTVSSRSVMSPLSCTSHNSSASARATAATKSAILKAEASTLKRLHDTEEGEIKLR